MAEFMAQISLVFLGDALLSVDVPLLQVRPNVGYLRSAVVWWRLRRVSVWRRGASGCLVCQRAWSISPRAVGGWFSSAWGCRWKPQATAAVSMAVSRSVGSCLLRRARSIALWYWDQACLSWWWGPLSTR